MYSYKNVQLKHVGEWSWRRLGRRKVVTLKTSSRRLKDMWRLKALWRQTKYLLGYLYLTNLNVYLKNLYFKNLYLTILRQIQNALIRTQWFHYLSCFGTQAASLFWELKSLVTALVSSNYLNSNSRFQKRWGYKKEFLSNILHKHKCQWIVLCPHIFTFANLLIEKPGIHLLRLVFYKQPVYKQLVLAWKIAKQLSGPNLLSPSNNKNNSLRKNGVFPLQ